ncbi:MAG: aminotransferase class I/II-fold pyridoxal phosphate-dependent enzyme [Treponema sp.]|jgi:aspartate/methionine/tyrosine aminotransferase|nr:aminotransferase class I/II-fold pyridoxal phosphate-dependent enzyme [Treponema sp.]
MNPLANELNDALDKSHAGVFLSSLGRRLFFPKGIIAQAAEAKKTARINATLGMAFKDRKPLILSPLAKHFPGLLPEEIVVYAPTAGIEALRNTQKAALIRKNSCLKEGDFSLPVVVPGITAGISYIADLFLDKGQVILAGDPSWDNYSLIFSERREAILKGIALFSVDVPGNDDVPNKVGVFNIDAFENALKEEAKTGQVRIILNFPHNPSGYTLLKTEAEKLIALINDCAEGGASVLVICDDAYFGLFYEDETINESLFGPLAALHERVLAVKIDGPTKEDYVWGLRTGFVSIGSKGLDISGYEALEKKLMGAIRSSVSCANTPAQYLALKTWEDPATTADKEAFFSLLCRRYRTVKQFIAENPPPSSVLETLPFNSGYFMCFRCKAGLGAEELRQALLKKGIGTIALEDKYLRVTFAAIEEEEIPEVYRVIYGTASELAALREICP